MCSFFTYDHFPPHGTNAPSIPYLRTKSIRSARSLSSSSWSKLKVKVKGRMLKVVYKVTQRHDNSHVSQRRKSVTLETGTPKTAICASPLTNLPVELVEQIMSYLPASSLYCLRQTSITFMVLFDTRQFERFHKESGPSSHRMAFNVEILYAAEKSDIANSLNHEMFCNPCLAAEANGTVAERLAVLRSLRHCDGCNRLHANALFFSEDQDRPDGNSGGLLCIGRRGHITLCNSHPCKPITWQDIESHVQHYTYTKYTYACADRSHQPEWEYNDRFYSGGSPFPRLFAQRRLNLPSVFEIGYGWDLPLLQIDHYEDPDLASVRKTLSTLVLNAFCTNRLCPHISADKEIQDFIQSGICICFTRYTDISTFDIFKGCDCGRQITLNCQVCGATYVWLRFMGQVILSLRYLWHIQKPTSPGWLSLLCKEKLVTQENHHVLWCETPSCRTNKRPRWEALVKEDSEREYLATSSDDAANCWDYSEGMLASLGGSYRTW